MSTPTAKRYLGGFTLLEVLVALAVFALSAFAVIRQTSQSVQQAEYLEQKSFALWLAENRLAQYRTAKEWPSIGNHSESVEQYGRSWFLQTDVYTTSDPWLRRVEVRVGREESDNSIITLQGFLGRY